MPSPAAVDASVSRSRSGAMLAASSRNSGMLMRDDRPEARSVLAFPNVETYRTLARRTKDPLQAAGVALSCWLARTGPSWLWTLATRKVVADRPVQARWGRDSDSAGQPRRDRRAARPRRRRQPDGSPCRFAWVAPFDVVGQHPVDERSWLFAGPRMSSGIWCLPRLRSTRNSGAATALRAGPYRDTQGVLEVVGWHLEVVGDLRDPVSRLPAGDGVVKPRAAADEQGTTSRLFGRIRSSSGSPYGEPAAPRTRRRRR